MMAAAIRARQARRSSPGRVGPGGLRSTPIPR